MLDQVQFDRWWGRVVGVLVLVFMGWFIAREYEGLLRLGELLVDAVIEIPNAIGNVITYYTDGVSGSALVASLLIGAVFGAVTTVFVYLSASERLKLPGVNFAGTLAGGGVLLLALYLELDFLVAVGGGLLVAFIVALVTQPELRQAVYDLPRAIASTPGLVAQGAFGGVLAGAIGSQILISITQHCTFSPEASPVEQQVGVLLTMASALLVLIPLWTIAQRRGKPTNAGTSGYFRGWALPFAFLLPSLLSLFVFLYYPAVQVAVLSLRAQRFRQERFVCLNNYIDLAADTVYRNSFVVTGTITIFIVVISMSMALMIALLAAQKVKGASIYRTLLIWPYALSPVVAGAIFLAIFRQGRSGLVNYALFELTGDTLDWFTNPDLAPWVIVFASVWNALGFNILFYIAGLQNIPRDLIEAAQIDGANVFQRFFRITFPLLSPFTFFLLVTNVTYSFYGIYGAVDTLTQGGPPLGAAGQDGGATDVLIYKLYEDAFAPGAQLGVPAAQSIVLFLLVAIITLVQFRYVESRVTYAE